MVTELTKERIWKAEHGIKQKKFISIYKDRENNAVISYSTNMGYSVISYIIGHYKGEDINVNKPENLLSFIEDIGFDTINDIVKLFKNKRNLQIVDKYGHEELSQEFGKEMY